jgi:hypothetical protein
MANYIVYIPRSPVEILTPTHWNLIGGSMIAQPPVLSPSSILAPPSFHCTCSSARKNSAAFQECYFILFAFLKLRKFEIA